LFICDSLIFSISFVYLYFNLLLYFMIHAFVSPHRLVPDRSLLHEELLAATARLLTPRFIKDIHPVKDDAEKSQAGYGSLFPVSFLSFLSFLLHTPVAILFSTLRASSASCFASVLVTQ
jgi:hypothetical protein